MPSFSSALCTSRAMVATFLPAVSMVRSATSAYRGRRSSDVLRATSRSWNKGRVEVSLMRDFASSAVTFRYTTNPASRRMARFSSRFTTPPPHDTSSGSLPASSRSTSVSMARKPSSPACAKISFTRLPSRRSRYVSMSTEATPQVRASRRATDVFPAPMNPTKNTGRASSPTTRGRLEASCLIAPSS